MVASVIETSVQVELEKVTSAAAKEIGMVVLRTIIRGTKSRPVIEIILDGSRLITVEDCEVVSKAATAYLDEAQGMSREYRIDVLSPGTDEPIVHPYQFQRTIGRTIEVTLKENAEKVTGQLRSITEEGIVIEKVQKKKPKETDPATTVSIPLSEIERTAVIVDFSGR